MIKSKYKNKQYSPLILFAYNRVNVLKQTIEFLKKNLLIESTDVFIFIDGPNPDKSNDIQKVLEVTNYIDGLDNFSKSINVFKHNQNIGLENSIIFGVNYVAEKYDNFIVLEDDLITSKYFLTFMNNSLEKYKNSKNVWTLNGMGLNNNYFSAPKDYLFDAYFTYRASSHGWGSWVDRWNKAIWDENEIKKELFKLSTINKFNRGGNDLSQMLLSQITNKIDSWAIKWSFTISIHNGICLSPINSYVSAQVDSGGTHIRTHIPLIDNDINKAKENLTFPKSIEVLDSIENKLYLIFSNLTENKIKISKGFLIKYYEYLKFWIDYLKLKYDVKSKKHKIKGFLKL